jgi:glycosyltransferase involved in cell wall biosynthesis
VETVLNPNRAFIDRAFSKASVYLSTQPTEAFGIAVVEAMARSCVPIVPRNGGPWFDILDEDQGRYGFAYSGPREAARMIEGVLSNDELRKGIAKRAQERALSYDSKRFRKEFVRLLENMSNRFLLE